MNTTLTSHKFSVVEAVLRSKSSFQQDLELLYPREELTVDLTFVSVDVFHDLFTYRWWWQFEGFEAREETQNAFSDLLGVVCLSHSLVSSGWFKKQL